MLKNVSMQQQFILPQIEQFYNYWRELCSGNAIPTRDMIDPCKITDALPMVTITEPISVTEADKRRYKFRLAGTGFWQFYEDDIQGQYVDELPIGCRADYWHRVLDQVIEHRRPFHGVTKPNTPIGSHLAQFWIRLPLSDDGVKVNMILGYDHMCKLEQAVEPVPERQKLYA